MTGPFTVSDLTFMHKALDLGKRGEGRVSPNPPVGCVLVRDGVIVGQGWHNRLGDLHAEAMALRNAGSAARGATCFVTLEPCATHGHQPPCADALIAAGVAEVVAATSDPNPKNCCGLDTLRAAGVKVRCGLMREEAQYMARGFFKLMQRRLPHVTLKYAMTVDGRIAASSGDSRWVSGRESREVVQDMRSRSDAILVGIGTALADDPRLNVRESTWSRRGGQENHPQPLRIIADSGCRLSPDAAMFRTIGQGGGNVLVAAAEGADSARIAALEQAGAEVLLLPEANGRIDLLSLMENLAKRGVAVVLCEGGAGLAAGLLLERLVDEVVAFVAPKIIGGVAAPGPIGELGLVRMAEAVEMRIKECKSVGNDILIRMGFQ